jgi:cytoskeleton protein RodZ
MDAIKPTGPGKRLRSAREAIKLSIDQVAHHLRLERQVIVDIESDHYEEMPRFTFIRGYLRSYARLVDLPADELVLAFDSLSLQEKPIKPVGEFFVVKERPNFKNLLKSQWVPYLLSATVVLLGALVYQSWTQQDLLLMIRTTFGI